MAMVEAEITVAGPQSEAWDFFFAQMTWPGWVDGFDRVIEVDGYPEVGGTLRWSTSPAGRGEVTEVVTEHDPRRLHVVEVSDQFVEGTLRTSFVAVGDQACRVHQQLEYKLTNGSPFSRVTDFFFIRPQMRGTIQRSLNAFRLECEDFSAAASKAIDELIG